MARTCTRATDRKVSELLTGTDDRWKRARCRDLRLGDEVFAGPTARPPAVGPRDRRRPRRAVGRGRPRGSRGGATPAATWGTEPRRPLATARSRERTSCRGGPPCSSARSTSRSSAVGDRPERAAVASHGGAGAAAHRRSAALRRTQRLRRTRSRTTARRPSSLRHAAAAPGTPGSVSEHDERPGPSARGERVTRPFMWWAILGSNQ